MTTGVSRRQFVSQTGAIIASSLLSNLVYAADESKSGMTLGFSTYALPNRTPLEAISLLSETGYDSVELCVFPPRGLPTAKEQFEIADHLDSTGLKLTSLMENLRPLSSEKDYETSTERFKQACEFAKRFTSHTPLVQTVLGGKDWNKDKDLCLERLDAWVKVAADAKVVLAIKPHRGHAMSRPADAIWLIHQLGNSPWLRMCYDYSHFIFRNMPMESTIKESLPYTAHIAVKDAVQVDGKVAFKSPGDAGTVDYVSLLKQFHAGGYRGDVCVEVSSQVWRQPGYDSGETVKKCYAAMSHAFENTKLRPAE